MVRPRFSPGHPECKKRFAQIYNIPGRKPAFYKASRSPHILGGAIVCDQLSCQVKTRKSEALRESKAMVAFHVAAGGQGDTYFASTHTTVSSSRKEWLIPAIALTSNQLLKEKSGRTGQISTLVVIRRRVPEAGKTLSS